MKAQIKRITSKIKLYLNRDSIKPLEYLIFENVITIFKTDYYQHVFQRKPNY